jgi:hypothetical protein
MFDFSRLLFTVKKNKKRRRKKAGRKNSAFFNKKVKIKLFLRKRK